MNYADYTFERIAEIEAMPTGYVAEHGIGYLPDALYDLMHRLDPGRSETEEFDDMPLGEFMNECAEAGLSLSTLNKTLEVQAAFDYETEINSAHECAA